ENCYHIFPIHLRKCPKCGKEIQIRDRELDEREGELVKLTPEMREVWAQTKADPQTPVIQQLNARFQPAKQSRLLNYFKKLAREKGYPATWPERKMKELNEK